MNKNVKRLSVFLAALMMSSAFAASASAIDTSFIKVKNTGAAVIDETPAAAAVVVETPANDTAVLKTSGWVKTDAGILEDTKSGYVFKAVNDGYVVKAADVVKKTEKNANVLCVPGGKYYSKKDAEKELKKFYEEHTYDFYMYRGDERTFCEGAYYVSSDPDVVYYDYKTETLVAKGSGNAEVYVYTKGGVPFFCMKVNVINKPGSTYSTLGLIPDEWHLDGAGDTTGFTVVTDKDWDADDFGFKIAHGQDIASITKSGKLKVTGKGPIVVRVYLKDNPNICGEALLYSGEYSTYFYDGYYKYDGKKYYTNHWGHDYDIGDLRGCYINGWIKSAEGIFIPVLKKSEATVEGKDTTIVYYDNVSIAELIRDAYGDKEDLYNVITKYNLFKDKDIKKDVVTWEDFDNIKYILSQMLGD